MVELVTFTTIKTLIGKKRVFIQASTIQELLNKLFLHYGDEIKKELFTDDNKLKPHYRIVVNGKNINLLDDYETPLNEDDMVAIMPAIAGG
ncbi:MAG: MoaD family protein [Candidatus Heimdallarchaeaceae archaeon]